jgi:hypothetical protein
MKRRLHIAGRATAGAHYTPSCEGCDVPPWLECACSSKLSQAVPDPRVDYASDRVNIAQDAGIAERINAEAQMRLDLALSDSAA